LIKEIHVNKYSLQTYRDVSLSMLLCESMSISVAALRISISTAAVPSRGAEPWAFRGPRRVISIRPQTFV